MPSDLTSDLRQALITGQDKYTHFLLATAAAAIAFSVQQTSGLTVQWSQLPLASAVAMWGYSFWCGCMRLEAIIEINAITLDIQLQRVMRDEPFSHDDRTAQKRLLYDKGNVAGRYWNHQFQALVAGGVSFVAWHIGEMILRANS